MAENDEYVNSEGLNVKRSSPGKKKHTDAIPTSKNNRTGMSFGHEMNNDTTASVAGSGAGKGESQNNGYLLDSVAQVMAETNKTNRILPSGSARPGSIVMREVQKKPVEPKSKPKQKYMAYNDDDSLQSSDEENDPIMNMIQQSRSTSSSSTRTPQMEERTLTTPETPKSSPKPKTKKDPNRFMSDLDARISTPLRPSYPTHSEHNFESQTTQKEGQGQRSPAPLHIFQSFNRTDNKLDWIRKNITPQKIKELVPISVPGMKKSASDIEEQYPLTGPNSKNSFENDDCEDEDRVTEVQSSAIIGDSENEELMRIRQRMNGNGFSMALDMMEKHAYYLWIAVPFLVTTLGYLWTRNRTDDGVTRF